MFTRELTLAGCLMAACTMAQAQTETSNPNAAAPRTVAALPAPVGDLEEPMPPSPVAEAAEGEAAPGLDANFGIGRPATDEEIAHEHVHGAHGHHHGEEDEGDERW